MEFVHSPPEHSPAAPSPFAKNTLTPSMGAGVQGSPRAGEAHSVAQSPREHSVCGAGQAETAAALFPHYSELAGGRSGGTSPRGASGTPTRHPLPEGLRARMEGSFGQSFADVSILPHSPIAQQHGAQAVAMGTDIHFAEGEYAPESASGWHLLGHELAHVAQQRGLGFRVLGSDANANGPGHDSSAGGIDWEAEAEAQGQLAARGESVAALGRRQSPSAVAPTLQCRKPGSIASSEPSGGNKTTTDDGAKENACQGGDEGIDLDRCSWQEQLGKFVGGPLYDLIAKNVEADDLQKYLKSGVDATLNALMGQIKKAGVPTTTPPGSSAQGLSQTLSDAQFEQLSARLKQTLKQAADHYAQSPGAQHLFRSIEGVVKDNPKGVVAALPFVLMGAAGILYLANWNPPAIAPEIKLGKSKLAVTPSVDLGPLQDVLRLRRRAIEAVGLEVSLKTQGLQASLGVEYENKQDGLLEKDFFAHGKTEINGNVSLNLSPADSLQLQGLLTLDPGGKAAKLKLGSEWQHKLPGEFLGGRNSTLKLQLGFEKGFKDGDGVGGEVKLSLTNDVLQFSTQYKVQQLPTLRGGGVDHQLTLSLSIHF